MKARADEGKNRLFTRKVTLTYTSARNPLANTPAGPRPPTNDLESAESAE
jgi:hypothetical protein